MPLQPRSLLTPLTVTGRVMAAWTRCGCVLGRRRWRRLRPQQMLIVGFISYVLLGVLFLSLPFSQKTPVGFIDNLFNVTSAVSTTGLVTQATGECYTFFGQLVHLVLFQLGGVGYMTISSFIILVRGRELSRSRSSVLLAGFTLPRYFHIDRFVIHLIAFTAIVEAIGTLLLWWRFSVLGVERPLWFAVFHCVSAFATAGFGLLGNSLEPFATDWGVNLTIAALAYLGAMGFIIVQDVWYSLRYRESMITFSTKVILVMTGAIWLLGTLLFFLIEPSVQNLPLSQRFLMSAFQVMTASTTAGFNTIPIGPLGMATLMIIVIVMLIGASPSGTGGGIKTTTISALAAVTFSVSRGHDDPTLLGNRIPPPRILSAVAATMTYVVVLQLGLLLLCLSERHDFLSLVFEACSALGTVGLSMGITADLTTPGKLILIAMMFIGRVGPLTFGLALLPKVRQRPGVRVDDLAT